MRKIIISIAGLVILGGGVMTSNYLSASKKAPEKKVNKDIKSVYIQTVENKSIPVSITTSGSILARDRMDIYAEVQGVFVPSSKRFKAGERYQRGEALVRINDKEFSANVVAQRSAFKSLITSILPDIQFDYKEAFDKWQGYLQGIDIHKNLPKLPPISSEKEQSYLTGKSIDVSFYNIKNLEARLEKYVISAPYKGVLVEASITPGTLVNQGQKLGEFIKPNIFELELNVSASLQNFLKIGKAVDLNNIDGTEKYTGKVTRINEKIDRASQTIKIFVEVVSNNLREGEYLDADIYAQEVKEAIEIPRTLLVNDNSIYTIRNNKLHIQVVNIFYSGLNTIIIKGLEEGMQYVSRPVASAFEGMEVKTIKG